MSTMSEAISALQIAKGFSFEDGEKRIEKNLLQTSSLDCDTLTLLGNAIKEEVNKREKEKLVLERFGEIKTVSKDGGKKILFIVRKNGKQITATTRESLVEKLYSMIEGETTKNITVEQLFEMYAQKRSEDTTISSRTSDFDRPNWKRFFGVKECKLKTMKVVDVSSFSILDEYKRIAGRGERTKKDFGKATGLMNGMFDLAVENQIVPINIARSVLPLTKKFTFKPEPDHSNDVWTQEERDALIEHIGTLPQTRYTLAIRLAACFALRVGELRALTWDDYDEKAKKLYIRHEIVKERKDGKNSCDADKPFTKGGKASGRRKVPVSSEAAKVLEELRAINGNKKYILNGEGNAKFAVSTNKINAHLKKYCEGAGVPYYSSHQFRFYGATQMYVNDVPLNTIRYYLGHSTIQMTLHYLRPDIEDMDEEIVNGIFGKVTRGHAS